MSISKSSEIRSSISAMKLTRFMLSRVFCAPKSRVASLAVVSSDFPMSSPSSRKVSRTILEMEFRSGSIVLSSSDWCESFKHMGLLTFDIA